MTQYTDAELRAAASLPPEYQAFLDTPPEAVAKPVTDEELQIKALNEFNALIDRVNALTAKMSSRQMGRVLRSLMGSPLKATAKFVDKEEGVLYSLAATVLDVKVRMLHRAVKMQEDADKAAKEQASALEETKKVAAELEAADNVINKEVK